MRLVIIAAVLIAVLAVAGVAIVRQQRATEAEFALSRDLQTGVSLAEATSSLRRHGVEFTIDSTADGNAVVRYRRKLARDRRMTSVTEQQLVFDAQQRLREQMTVSQLRIE